jgi:hypothetical protein
MHVFVFRVNHICKYLYSFGLKKSDLVSSQIVNSNNYGDDNYSKEFGMKVTNQLALVDARVLPAPRVISLEPSNGYYCFYLLFAFI